MKGGAFSINIYSYSFYQEGGGGGVSVRGGKFTMNSGDISGNSIYNTSSVYSYGGGGVAVANGSTFTMKVGTISGNTTSLYGGGVGVANGSTFTMKGGTIRGNTAGTYGGGGGVASGTFTKADPVGSDGSDGFSGIIYGWNISDDLKNIVGTRDTGGNVLTHNDAMGHAAYAGGKKRTNTAYEGDNMDSAQTGVDGGGWD
jgi:hypothetical protein